MSDEEIKSQALKREELVEGKIEQGENENKEEASWGIFLVFSYLYLVQGAVMGLVGTMPYIYPQLPDIDTMALFNSISLPYSFKFLVAPFLEKFASVEYGKRKTWLVLSLACAGGTMLVASFFTGESQAKTFALLCFVIQIWMVVQNIALHSLIIKEIPDPHRSSLIQSFAEVLGILLGGLMLLKLTSSQFGRRVGLQGAITNAQTVLLGAVVLIWLPALSLHCGFHERVLESEKRGSRFSFCQIVKNYRVFLDPCTQYFRFCMIVVLYNQGLNFFYCLYDYKLVAAGFSRDTSNTISNAAIVPIVMLTFFFGKWTQILGGNRNAIMFTTVLIVAACLYILLVFPTDVFSVAVLTFTLGLLDSWRFYSFGVMINSFPLHALSGMFITVLGSYFNFGRLTFLHTYLSGHYGWKQLSLIGLGVQMGIVMATPRLFRWLEDGDLTLPKEIEEGQQGNKDYQEMNDAT